MAPGRLVLVWFMLFFSISAENTLLSNIKPLIYNANQSQAQNKFENRSNFYPEGRNTYTQIDHQNSGVNYSKTSLREFYFRWLEKSFIELGKPASIPLDVQPSKLKPFYDGETIDIFEENTKTKSQQYLTCRLFYFINC